MSFVVEICVDSVESAVIALEAGADRVELCSALAEGGVTPSLGLINSVCGNTGIPVHVLIRPRSGDFLYSDTEFSVMRRDIEIAGEAGADGIVTGILLSDGRIDVERTSLLAQYASPMSVTFHRAFDMCRDPRKALNDVTMTGASRLLTSGQAKKAVDGVLLIKDLVKAAGNRIIIMPGSGIDEYNISALATATGAHEFHLSGSRMAESLMTFRKKGVSMGSSSSGSEYAVKTADPDRIRSVLKILKGLDI